MSLHRRRFLASALAAPALLSGTRLYATEIAPSSQGQTARPKGAIQRFYVGDIEIIALWDGFTSQSNAVIHGFDETKAEKAAHSGYDTFNAETTTISVNGYVIKTADKTIAIDAGAPSLMGPTVANWTASLELAGLAPSDIDTVFLTHMHLDHVGGLIDLQTRAATMPRAELIAAQSEWDFTFDDDVYAAVPEAFRAGADFSRFALSKYKKNFNGISMERETEIVPGLNAFPMPGHTPGHMGLRVHQGNEQLVIWGDAIHFAAYQFMQPDWGVLFDSNVDQAIATRRAILAEAASDRIRVAGMHLDFPAVGYVEANSDNYRYIPAAMDFNISG